MKTFCTLIFAALCATAGAQTIKSIGYNTTNGQLVAATNIVWTNAFTFSTNTVAAQVRTNLGLGATNDVIFQNIIIADQNLTLSQGSEDDVFVRNESGGLELGCESYGSFVRLEPNTTNFVFNVPAVFNNATNAATTRTNLGLGNGITTNITFVDAATNTNSVTISNGIITGWTQ